LTLGSLTSSTALGAAPQQLWKAPEDGLKGDGPGRFANPWGVATDASSGHVFVSDSNNARVSEFEAFGQFVKAFGWGVVASGPDDKPKNERQELVVNATGGTFQLTYINALGGTASFTQTTGPIPFNASAPVVQNSIQGLESFGPGHVAVSGSAGAWTIEFIGPFADLEIPVFRPVTKDSEGNSTLTGGSETAIVTTLQDGANFEVCRPEAGDICQAGQKSGSLPGEINEARGVAVDSSGNVYLAEGAREISGAVGTNFRVQKFSPVGQFLLMFGGDVNKTKAAEGGSTEAERNLCTAADMVAGDECGAGTPGVGDGQFAEVGAENRIAVSPDGTVAVGDSGRIQEFFPSGAFKNTISLGGTLSGKVVASLATDPTNNFWLTTTADKGKVFKLQHNGNQALEPVQVEGPRGLAVDSKGNLYVASVNEASREEEVNGELLSFSPGEVREVVTFDAAGKPLLSQGSGFARSLGGNGGGLVHSGLATNVVSAAEESDVYYINVDTFGSESFLSAYGPAPDKWAPPLAAPEIVAQFASSIKAGSAALGAEINPHFWADTSYWVEYGTGKCSEGGCANLVPSPPGAPLGSGITGRPVSAGGIEINGLSPNTTYHYRIATQSTGSGDQPVRGVGGKVGTDGAESSFTTLPAAPPPFTGCPNQAFRTGAGGRLPDCRAYEMVSPVEKNNVDIKALPNLNGNLAALNQSSGDGEKITYTTSQGFGDAQGVPYISQYIASRSPGGWSSHGVTPPQGFGRTEIGNRIDVEFRAFSEDLCSSYLLHGTDPALASGAIKGFFNLYQRTNCDNEGYRSLSTVTPPPGSQEEEFVPELQQISEDGHCGVFFYADTAHPLYESCEGALRLLSVLPSGAPSPSPAWAGTANSSVGIRTGNSTGAISADGSRIYWSSGGNLYLRLNAGQEQSALSGSTCTEPEKACTVEVPDKAQDPHFWGASTDGARAIYSLDDNKGNIELDEYDLAGKKAIAITNEVLGVAGVSKDARRVAFVSHKALGASANAEGKSPTAGQPNLYLFDGDLKGSARFRFIGTIAAADARMAPGFDYSMVAAQPYKHLSRLTPDGQHLAFMSAASLTGYENVDARSGRRDAEIYLYDASAEGSKGALKCLSCNPSGQRPSGRPLQLEERQTETWAAALLAPPETEAYAPRSVARDGSMVFFDSYEQLLPADENQVTDVYQWEAAGSEEDGDRCTVHSPRYSPPNGGCLALISSGHDDSDSVFLDADASGRDIFLATNESLIASDTGLIDIYDARLGGGFATPAAPPTPCQGEACQSIHQGAAQLPAPQSGTRAPETPTFKPTCAKSRHAVKKKGQWRCVKNKGKKKAHKKRGSGR
jgi:hypothetical protein